MRRLSLFVPSVLVAGLIIAGPLAAEDLPHVEAGATLRLRMPPGGPKDASVMAEISTSSAGPLTIDAFTYDFDPILRVERRLPDGGLAPVAEDDDSGVAWTSRIVIDVEAGATYLITLRPAADLHGGEVDLSVSTGRPAVLEPLTARDAEERFFAAAVDRVRGRGLPEYEARVVAELGWALKARGEYAPALEQAERALQICEEALHGDPLPTSRALNLIGQASEALGDYDRARRANERAIELVERAQGPEGEELSGHVNNLAVVIEKTGDYLEALRLYRRALAINEKLRGPEASIIAINLNNIGNIQERQGLWHEAKATLERALAIAGKSLGPESLHAALVLSNLATVERNLGSYDAALDLNRRATSNYERSLGPDHPEIIPSLSGQAGALKEMGRREEALLLYRRCLAIAEARLGPDHLTTATILNNMARLLAGMGRAAEASPLQERAVAIAESHLGRDHTELARALATLAFVVERQGDDAQAESLYARAAEIVAVEMGPWHEKNVDLLGRRAAALARLGRPREALAASLRAEEIARAHLRLVLQALPEEAALRFAAARASALDIALTVLTRSGVEQAGRAREVWDAIIRSRALVFDEMGARQRVVTGQADPEITQLAGRFSRARTRLANLAVRGTAGADPAIYRSLFEQARRESDEVEKALAAKSLAFRLDLERGRIGFEEVARALPPGSALLAYAAFDRAGVPGAPASREYAAFVLGAGSAEPAVVPLGTAGEIDALVAEWRAAATRVARAGETTYRTAATDLRRRIWNPLEPHLGEARRVFVVPEGALALVNLAALPVGRSAYLLEAGPLLHVLSSERDLALVPAARTGLGLLALGGPAFDATVLFAALSPPPAGVPGEGPLPASVFRGPLSSCRGFADLRFSPLTAAAEEAQAVGRLWAEAAGGNHVLTGAQATEAAFKREAAGRRTLHLATHGFFFNGICADAPPSTRAVAGLIVDEIDAPPTREENPMRLSGIALAGANHRAAAAVSEEDGILTAEEVAALDLSGVEWAVLSACDTGLGDVRAGEGVLGLRRAFQVAGARTAIMSLWAVDDDSARLWMEALYRARLRDHVDTAASVRQAGLEVLRQRRARGESTHPFFWAGFIASGDWR